MAIQIKCAKCNKLLRVADGSEGKRVKCPACATVLTIPAKRAQSELEKALAFDMSGFVPEPAQEPAPAPASAKTPAYKPSARPSSSQPPAGAQNKKGRAIGIIAAVVAVAIVAWLGVTGRGAWVFLAYLILWMVMPIPTLIGMWKVFTKAGKHGWESLIPIYNVFVWLDIAGKSPWWFLLLLMPIGNLWFWLEVTHCIAANFGKGSWFTVGLLLLPGLFYPILGFGSAQYVDARVASRYRR